MKKAGWAAVLTNGKLHYLEPEPDARCEFSYYVLCGGWTLSSPAQFIANPVPQMCCKRCVKKQAARAAGRASDASGAMRRERTPSRERPRGATRAAAGGDQPEGPSN